MLSKRNLFIQLIPVIHSSLSLRQVKLLYHNKSCDRTIFRMTGILNTERFQEKKYFFRVQKWGWRIVGFWPGMKNISALRIALAVANSIEILVYSVFQLLYCYHSADNLVSLLDALTPVLTQITTAIKVLIIVARRDDIKFILDYVKQSFYNGKFDQHFIIRWL